MAKLKVREITFLATFIVLDIILTRFFSINVWNIRIGFGFIPTIMVAHMYGMKFTIIECALSDIIGAILFPTGVYFVGFTISAIVMGVIWSVLLYKHSDTKRIILAILLDQIICSTIITPISISILYSVPLLAVIIGRIGQLILVSLMEILMVPILINKICPLFMKQKTFDR